MSGEQGASNFLVGGFGFGVPCFTDSFDWPDLNDPPVYESEAAYLRRHRLLAAAERKQTSEKAFAERVNNIETPASCI